VITYTALVRRTRAELTGVRRRLARTNRWQLARWLLLPGLFVWIAVPDVAAHPWHAIPVTLTAAALLARYRWPATTLLLVALSSGIPPTIFALPLVAYGAGRRLTSTRRTVLTFAAAAAAAAGNALLFFDFGASQPGDFALVAGAVTIVVLFPAAIGIIRGERARRVDALQERNATLERARRLGDLRARMQERARIAGEMHDLLGHRLSLISLHAGALEVRTRRKEPELSGQAELIRQTAGTALDELREVLGILRVDTGRADGESPADGIGTRADIEALVEASRAAGQAVELDWDGDDLAGTDVRIRRAVHRLVRESLTNVHKHAPQAAAGITVRVGAAQVVVQVRNPLRTLRTPAPGTGLGLVGLQERVQLIGGTMTTGRDGGEFVLTATLPSAVPGRSPAGGSDRQDAHIDQEDLIDRQTPGADPVIDAEGHLKTSIPRSTRTMSKPAKIILFSVIGIVVLVCGGGAIGAYVLSSKAKHAAITPAQYGAVQLGQTRAQVTKTIGDVGSIAELGVDKTKEPAAPAGTTCEYALSTLNVDKAPVHVYRFCFAADKLVEKKDMIVSSESKNP
jgi:signal transduction histidine kinase